MLCEDACLHKISKQANKFVYVHISEGPSRNPSTTVCVVSQNETAAQLFQLHFPFYARGISLEECARLSVRCHCVLWCASSLRSDLYPGSSCSSFITHCLLHMGGVCMRARAFMRANTTVMSFWQINERKTVFHKDNCSIYV